MVLAIFGLTAAFALAVHPVAQAAPSKGEIVPNAYLKLGGKRALVGGFTPVCTAGYRYFLDVKVRRKGQVAWGAWRSKVCAGGREGWQAVLSSSGGKRLKRGWGRVEVTAKLREGGKTKSVRKFGGRVRLSTDARPVTDRNIYGGLTFDVGAGASVQIEGGGASPLSWCTRDETVSSFTTTSDSERKLVQFVAKDDGTCWTAASWSNFRITVSRPGFSYTGTMWLGQSPGAPYYISCYWGNSSEVSTKYRYNWTGSGLRCQKTGDYEVKISIGT